MLHRCWDNLGSNMLHFIWLHVMLCSLKKKKVHFFFFYFWSCSSLNLSFTLAWHHLCFAALLISHCTSAIFPKAWKSICFCLWVGHVFMLVLFQGSVVGSELDFWLCPFPPLLFSTSTQNLRSEMLKFGFSPIEVWLLVVPEVWEADKNMRMHAGRGGCSAEVYLSHL